MGLFCALLRGGNTLKSLPYTARDLIAGLDKLYPPRPPRLAASDREVWFEAGQRAVVEQLLTMLARDDKRTSDRILE